MNDPSDDTKYRYPHLYMPKEGYVFIITYGRSGSTLTQNLLNSLPGYCIRGENSNLLYFLSKAADLCKYQGNFVLRRGQLQLPFEERKQGLKVSAQQSTSGIFARGLAGLAAMLLRSRGSGGRLGAF